MSTLKEYIGKVEEAIETQNARRLRRLLLIGHPKASIRAEFPTPLEFDVYKLDKFGPVIINHLQMLKSTYVIKNVVDCFENINLQCTSLIRACAQVEGNWIMPVLLACVDDLIMIYNHAQKTCPEDLDQIMVDSEYDEWGGGGDTNGNGYKKMQVSRLEKLVNTLKSAFNLTNNDKTLDIKLSKRNDIYFFLSHLVKYYFKMGKLTLAKSAINSAKSGNRLLPNMMANVLTIKNAITYLYYQALVCLDDGQWIEAEESLNKAMCLIANYKKNARCKQLEKILRLLIPLKLYNKGKIPLDSLWQRFPRLKLMYHDWFLDAILHGNLNKYEECMQKFQVVLLRNHLYILMELLRQFVQLRVLHKTYNITLEFQAKEDPTPFSAFKIALELSMYPGKEKEKEGEEEAGAGAVVNSLNDYVSDFEVETIVCNLITQGYIKGYVSNTNRVVVFSKSLPFPKITEVKVEA